ncbi:MAG: flagellar filament capping protein FliD [Bdellovibrionales bacterium]|nr:flagellar filament capping protein FliD [Bdellovibrionales bacterium]
MPFYDQEDSLISFGGLASGLPPDIVDQLMEVEKIPIKNMEAKKGKSEGRLKLVNELDTKLTAITGTIGTLASTKGFNDIKLISGDNNVVQGTVDPSLSNPGNWNIEVVELAQKAAALTNRFPDKDVTELGTGYFKFDTPEGAKEVYVSGSGSTLEGVANAINKAHVGVRASIINDRKYPDEPFRLMLSGESVGGENTIQYPTLYLLDGDQDVYFEEEREAKNGVIKVDGFEFEVASNTVTDVIPGVTLELKQASPGRSVNVTVKEDQEAVSGKIKEFVDAMNGVFKFIQSQNRLDKNTDTSKTLGGDSLLRSIESRLRNLVQNTQYGINGPIKRLGDIGISFNRSGTLDYDEEKFNAKLAKNPESIQQFFAGDGFSVGFIPSLRNSLKVIQDTSFGPISNRKRSLQSKIDQFDRRIEQKEKLLSQKQQNLKNKFARLEASMSRLKSQGAQLAATTGTSSAIPGLG